ncbi:MAG: hypothetical protein WCW02_03105 [Candidatus Buchananbacteria bacterium]
MNKKPKAWVVTVDMGYGHQRATYPLKDLAVGEIIDANNYPGMPAADRKIWEQSTSGYEAISRFKKVPLVGELSFDLFDYFQSIENFYPRRDLSKPTLQLKMTYKMIKQKSWGKHLINKLAQNPLPLITPFFTTAYMAEIFGYPGEIYLIVCDADISRAWAPLDSRSSKIKYFAPTTRVVERLKLYAVKAENIFLTGFPLPKENLGGPTLPRLKRDLKERLAHLDPNRIYFNEYKKNIATWLGISRLPDTDHHPLTIAFAVGGAGAQQELGITIVKSLRQEILQKKVYFILIAGSREEIYLYFKQELSKLKLSRYVKIIYNHNKLKYLAEFNRLLHQTDVLWTKPSELSFYSALGLPIIIAPPIGSQEKFNRQYIRKMGAGLEQEDPRYTNEWLLDWHQNGFLAEAAMQGFIDGNKLGAYNIEKIIEK